MKAGIELTQEIIELSHSDIWDIAKQEWDLKEIYECEDLGICPCCNSTIKKVCIIQNSLNKNTIKMSSCCCSKLFQLPSDKIIQAIRCIKKDKNKPLNAEAIEYAFHKKWIDNWEYRFSINTMRKLKLSEKQLEIRHNINMKMLSGLRKNALAFSQI